MTLIVLYGLSVHFLLLPFGYKTFSQLQNQSNNDLFHQKPVLVSFQAQLNEHVLQVLDIGWSLLCFLKKIIYFLFYQYNSDSLSVILQMCTILEVIFKGLFFLST